MGRKLRVEEIRDDPKMGRVKVPEKIVTYVLGEAKNTRSGGSGSGSSSNNNNHGLRRISRLETTKNNNNNNNNKQSGMAEKQRQRPPKSSSSSSSSMFSCLKSFDQEEMVRATKRGYISLEGLGYGTGRSKSRLASAHRQWCDEQCTPQIVHCKAVHDGQLDRVIVDLSPLRVACAVMGADYDVNDFLVRWKAQIATAAAVSNMELLEIDNLMMKSESYERLSLSEYEDDGGDEPYACDDPDCAILFDRTERGSDDEPSIEYIVEVTEEDPYTVKQPISRLPVLTMGVFEGDRSKAKAMAKELAVLWAIPGTETETNQSFESYNGDNKQPSAVKGPTTSTTTTTATTSRGPRQRRERKRENRRRRRNTRDDLNMLLF
jgi:hypothetical protein